MSTPRSCRSSATPQGSAVPQRARPAQRALFCSCGRDLPWIAGLCGACYRSAARSRQRFAGLRDEILDRDGRLCRACGSAGRLPVHHRQPGVHERDLLKTMCAGYHAHLDRLAALDEHPGAPVQLQLAVAA